MFQKLFAVLFSAGGILLFAGCATVSPDIPESFAAQEWRANGTFAEKISRRNFKLYVIEK